MLRRVDKLLHSDAARTRTQPTQIAVPFNTVQELSNFPWRPLPSNAR